MSDPLVARLIRELERFEHSPSPESVGTVVAVGDGVALIEGLPQAVMAEMIEFDTTDGVDVETALKKNGALYGVILNLEEFQVKAVVLGDTRRVREGMTVRARGSVLSVPVGESLIGRVVSTLGEVKDGGPAIVASAHYPVERPSYGVIDRESVNQPLHTGIKSIDAMVPIGRGQRELIIGDRHTGKTTIAIDTIIHQREEPKETRPICVYVAIGQKESKVARTVAHLKERGAMEYTIVVSAAASEPAALQFLAPYAGVSMAEYFLEKGKDVLIIYDDLSKQAVAYREIALLLRRPPGREAFPGDIFYLHSRLLERAAKLSKEKGGGSITALPIIETQEGDVSAYIPTNVISITDGQIYLETDLFNKGVRPAINVGLSVSRVGSSAQTKAMKKVAGRMRLELAQFRELEAFAQFASDLDEETKRRIEKGARLVEVLKQGQGAPLPFERQVAVIFAANSGLFDTVEVARTRAAATSLLEFLETQHSGLLSDVRATRDLGESAESTFAEAFDQFRTSHPAFF